MNNHRTRNQNALKHLHDIESVGLKNECPLNPITSKKPTTAQLTEVITWLKLQNHKMGYRLLYCDVAVCCTYIVFLFTALRFHAQVLPNRWFYGFTMLMLVCGCLLFIGVHLLPHKRKNSKFPLKALADDWSKFCAYFRRWPKIMIAYVALLTIFTALFTYNANQPSRIVISLLLMLMAALYAYGITMIVKATRTKSDTSQYIVEAGRTKYV